MKKSIYKEQANLAAVIDIALAAIETFTPKEWNEDNKNHILKTYMEWKHQLLNPKPEFHNIQSLNYIANDIFIYFQEGSGRAVNFFWAEVNASQLGYKRKNNLTSILKRGKIRNQIEYDLVVDVIVPYHQENLINESEVVTLNNLMKNYEMSGKNK